MSARSSLVASWLLGLVFVAAGAWPAGAAPATSEVVYSAAADDAMAGRGRLDVYAARESSRPAPLIVWFHGGGITSGSKDHPETTHVAERLSASGAIVVAPNYRLSPQARFPAYVEDAAQAVAWAVREASALGADPTRIFVGGYSAGAYLAAMLALDSRYLREAGVVPGQIAGYVCLSGQMTTHFTVRKERELNPVAVVVDEAAPAYHVRRDAPRMLLLVGDGDLPARKEENQLIAAALTEVAGSPHITLRVVADRNHGTIAGRFMEPGDAAGEAMRAFIRE